MLEENYTTPYQPTEKRFFSFRKLVILVCGVVVLGVAIPLLVRHFTFGGLVVNTNSKNALITITRSYSYNESSASSTPINATSGQTISLHTGKYSVLVWYKNFSSQQEVSISAHHTTSLTLTVDQASPLEPITSEPASNVVSGPSGLLFTNAQNGNLDSVSTQGSESVIARDGFTSVKWADSGFGIAKNTSGKLFSIINGTVSPLTIASGFIDSPYTQFTVAPNHNVYIASGSSIYEGNVGSFKKIFTTTSPVSALSASDNSLAFFEGRDSDTGRSKSFSSSFYVLSSGGTMHISNIDVTNSAWSATGKYLAGVANGQLVIWTRSLHKIAQIPVNVTANMLWVGDNTLLYGLNNALWSYNLNSQKSQVVGQSTLGQLITQLSLSAGGSYVYLSLENTHQPTITYELARIGLHNQQINNSNLIGQLSVFLPYNVSVGCNADYLNFNSPSVIIESNQPQSCTQATQSYLEESKISLSSVSFQQLTP